MAARFKPLDQQVMVITGASSGIGLCTALLAAEKGAGVVLAARSGDTLEAVVKQLTEAGHEAIAVPTDVGDREQLQNLAAAAIQRFGRIDTWVNDAGPSRACIRHRNTQ
ncbi:SDR family NAD(P)-dependent oxidoreductase [Frateuria sp. MAH-13]|uniref:SDR family NAD(P)-dependent oxidoreductase n=1 Tax=Frateuria flava TaxID=2821489 RepID=A0ABS4DS65_9GAMM|nr:SDR family NAD(P)-dependent oxidoreductase [Frateuria flava]MBP1475898.1 SDR family NAD(P)-dependent oxidoreductase [Frateuria flava]